MSKILVIGSTSGIANEAIKIWLEQGNHIHLYARNHDKLKMQVADLEIRFPGHKIDAFTFEANNLSKTLDQISLDNFDIALITVGELKYSDELVGQIQVSEKLINSNIQIPLAFAQTILEKYKTQGYGKLGIIGSVAGDRGRGKNYLYGASKAFWETYLEGARQEIWKNKNISLSLIKPGPTNTAMVQGRELGNLRLAKPEAVAKVIVNGMERGKSVIYAPKIFQLIMFIFKIMPIKIFNRLSF